MLARPAFQNLLLTLASATLSTLGIVYAPVWFLAPLGLAIFLYTLHRVEKLRAGIAAGFVYGSATGGGGIVWFFDTLPLDWLFIHDPLVQVLSLTMTWAYITLALGVAVALGSIALWYLVRAPYWFIFVPFLWLIIEEGRAWMFAVFTYAPQSLLGGHFSPAAIGYPLAESSYLLELAHPFGMYGLSFAAALFACVLAYLRTRGVTRRAQLVSLVVLFATCAAPLLIEPASTVSEGRTLTVALLGTTVAAGSNARADEARALLERTIEDDPDLIVLPEAIMLEELYGIESGITGRALLAGHPGTMLAHTVYQDRAQTLLYETADGVTATYQKMFLMPLGEYAPAFSSIFYNGIKDEALKSHIQNMRFYYERGDAVATATHNGARLGGLLCSEVLSPHLYATLVNDHDADILLNLSNNSWFHDSRTLHTKLLQVAKTHAVATRKYFLVAANDSPAYALDPNGRVIGMTGWSEPETLTVEIPY